MLRDFKIFDFFLLLEWILYLQIFLQEKNPENIQLTSTMRQIY